MHLPKELGFVHKKLRHHVIEIEANHRAFDARLIAKSQFRSLLTEIKQKLIENIRMDDSPIVGFQCSCLIELIEKDLENVSSLEGCSHV